MPNGLTRTPLPRARGERQTPVRPVQRLATRQFIGAQHPLPAPGQRGGRTVEGAYRRDFRRDVLLPRGSQPVADQTRVTPPLFKSRAAGRGALVSPMPRLVISATTSRAVPWLLGRPEGAGAAHASAMSAQTCSAPMRAGAPGRGASAKRSALLSSCTGTVSVLASAVPPQPRRLAREPYWCADLHRAQPRTGCQDVLRPRGHRPRCAVGARQAFPLPPLLRRHAHSRWLWPPLAPLLILGVVPLPSLTSTSYWYPIAARMH